MVVDRAVEVDASEDDDGSEADGLARDGELELRDKGTTETDAGRALLLRLLLRLCADGRTGDGSSSLGGGVGGVDVHVGVGGADDSHTLSVPVTLSDGTAIWPPSVR